MRSLLQLIPIAATLLALVQPAVVVELEHASANGNGNGTITKLLSRQKRYLAFPEGSSVSAAICLTIGMIGNPNVDFLSWAVNWGVAYNLPNHNWVKQHAHGFGNNLTQPLLQRRSRRSFYEELQSGLNHIGFNGAACVARALCESAKYMYTPGRRGNMLEELVRTVLSLPRTPVAEHEPAAHHQYDAIYRRSKRQLHNCQELYPGCQFSLLALALGKYGSTPAQLSKYHFM